MTIVQRPLGDNRFRLDTVVAHRPRCPRCNGVGLRKHRSLVDQGDGTAVSWVRCVDEACGHRFRIVHR